MAEEVVEVPRLDEQEGKSTEVGIGDINAGKEQAGIITEASLRAAVDVLKEASDKRAAQISKDASELAAKMLEDYSITGSNKEGSDLIKTTIAGLLDIAASANGAVGEFTNELYKKQDERMKGWLKGLSDLLSKRQALKEGRKLASMEHHNEAFGITTERGLLGHVEDAGEKMRLGAMEVVIRRDLSILKTNGERYKKTSDMFNGFSVGLRKMAEVIRGKDKEQKKS